MRAGDVIWPRRAAKSRHGRPIWKGLETKAVVFLLEADTNRAALDLDLVTIQRSESRSEESIGFKERCKRCSDSA